MTDRHALPSAPHRQDHIQYFGYHFFPDAFYIEQTERTLGPDNSVREFDHCVEVVTREQAIDLAWALMRWATDNV